MQVIDSGSCRTSSGAGQTAATQGANGLHGSSQDRADALVRATVLSDLGQGTAHGRHSHGIQGVAAAVRTALAGQDVTGTDAADDVLKKIETSLHKAAQKLADRGVDAKTIDATIDKFRSQLANALDGTTGAGGSTGSGASSGSGTSAGSSAAGSGSSGTVTGAGSAPPPPAPTSTTSASKFVSREVRKESGAIDLVTAEGDRVSIRFRTKEVASGSITQSTAADGTSTTATKGSVFSRGGVKIEVDGDLNADEQKAIGDLLGKVDDIATQFFSGDVQAAFSAAGSLGVGSDQIAAYRLNLTYSRKIAAYGAVTGVPVSTQAPASASGTTPPASDNSSGASASDPSPTGSTPTTSTTADAGDSGSSAAGSGTSGTPATGDTSATPPASAPPASAQKTILDFINDALSKLGSVSGAGRVSFSSHWKMSVLVTALQSVQPAQPTTAADQTAANNTQLLGDSLQKIVAA